MLIGRQRRGRRRVQVERRRRCVIRNLEGFREARHRTRHENRFIRNLCFDRRRGSGALAHRCAAPSGRTSACGGGASPDQHAEPKEQSCAGQSDCISEPPDRTRCFGFPQTRLQPSGALAGRFGVRVKFLDLLLQRLNHVLLHFMGEHPRRRGGSVWLGLRRQHSECDCGNRYRRRLTCAPFEHDPGNQPQGSNPAPNPTHLACGAAAATGHKRRSGKHSP